MNHLLTWLGLDSSTDVHRLVEGHWHVGQPITPTALAIIVIVGLALSLVNFLPFVAMRWSVRIWTFLLRLAIVGLLVVVWCGLEWHVQLETNAPQQWEVLVDDSASMVTRDVSDKNRYAAAQEDLKELRDAVGDRVALSVRTFNGQPLTADKPGQGPTRFQEVVSSAALAREQLDRVVILTDGRDSDRRDLQRLGENLKARQIALSVRQYGSDVAPADAVLAAEPERSVIRLGEELIVRGAVSGAPQGEQTVVVKENGKQVASVVVSSETHGRFEARYRPAKKGQHAITLELASRDAVAENNQTTFTLKVVEEKINVLLIEGFPRFEFKLIKGVLEVDPLVKLVCLSHIPGGGVYVQGEPLHKNAEQGLISSQAELFKYDVIVLRDVPRSYFRAGGDASEGLLRNIVEFVTKRGGGLIALGGQDVYRAGGYEGSHLAEVLPFDLSAQISGEPQFEGQFFVSIPKPAYEHPCLRLLADANENRERLNGLRQLDGCNNVGRFKPLATPLMTRTVKVKGPGESLVDAEVPILGYLSVGEGKVLAASVDTLWRWQLQPDYDDPPLAMLLANSIRYLAPPPDRRPGAPNVSATDGTPQVGQELVLETDLKDPNYDPIRNAELVVTVTSPDAKSYRMYPRDLPEEPGHYIYRVRLDQPGEFQVAARFGKLDVTRQYMVGAASGEYADLSADRDGMKRFVAAAGGELVDGPLDAWLATVDTTPARKPAVRELELWNSPLVLVLFILLVSADCYIRKRQGLA